MRKLIISLVSVASALSAGAAAPDVMLYGQMYTGTGDYGVYSFSSGATEGFEKVAGIAAEPNCGSVSAGSRFYAFSAEPGEKAKNTPSTYMTPAQTTVSSRVSAKHGQSPSPGRFLPMMPPLRQSTPSGRRAATTVQSLIWAPSISLTAPLRVWGTEAFTSDTEIHPSWRWPSILTASSMP